MDTQQNLNIASNSKRFPKLFGILRTLLDYCGDYFDGRKHEIRPVIERKVGKIESLWQYIGDYLGGNKYGYIESGKKQK